MGSLTALLLCWSVFCLIFFSLSRSKLPGYILPAVPAMALLLSRSCTTLPPKKSRFLHYFPLTFAVSLLIAAGAVGSLGRRLVANGPGLSDSFAILASLVFLVLAVANIFLAHAISVSASPGRTLRPHVALTIVSPMLILMLSMGRFVPTFFSPDPSGKTIAKEILSSAASARNLSIHGMNRGMHLSLNFYLRQEIPDWDPAAPTEGYLLLSGRGCKYLVQETAICEEPPLFLEASDRFLYRVKPKPSLDRLGGGRQPKQKE
jgi:4-amino-4-deoxy-L-arabinose transferase-like glycosyltransferase